MRAALEAVDELDLVRRTIAVFGIGCYTAFSNNLDVEVLQALHGRAPSLATGVKRARPDTVVFTVQGDGDMVNEGLQEVIHTAARGENVTCVMLNNGVFGETGGHMTATTVARASAPRTASKAATPVAHGYPILLRHLLAQLDGAAYVARGAVNNAGNVARTKKMLLQALRTQIGRRRVLVRRDPDHVPDGLVHRDPGSTRLPRRQPGHRPHRRGPEGRPRDERPTRGDRDARRGVTGVVLGHDPARRQLP